MTLIGGAEGFTGKRLVRCALQISNQNADLPARNWLELAQDREGREGKANETERPDA